ncbi:ankyrin repeat-containing domain protein [Xylaria scruposa]|nr:ankyrin repeat-containing domain protein [Xylaria scruposa]
MTGDLAPARLLVELGADVNARGDGLCPIFAALNANGDSTATKDVHGYSEANPSPLYSFFKREADHYHLKEDRTPLMYAASRHSEQAVEMCEILIMHGANVDARNSKDRTALHFSVEATNIKNLKLLLSHSADLDAQDQTGESALHIAARQSGFGQHNFDKLELLLQSGANLAIKNNAGRLPFQECIIRLCRLFLPPTNDLEDHIELFARFDPSPSDLVATACADGEAMKLAAGLENSEILKVLLSHGGASSNDILRESIYSSFDHMRPQNFRMLMRHANPFRVAENKHMAFLFLITISRDAYVRQWGGPDADIPMETRVQKTKSLPLRYPERNICTDECCDILRTIWGAGFDANTVLDAKFVNHVSTYRDEFSSLVRVAEQFGNPSSLLPRQETISAVVFAAQHVPSAMVVLALLEVNSCRDDFKSEEILEALIRSAVYKNLEVYDECRKTVLGTVNEDSAGGGQTRGISHGAFERSITQELRQIVKVFPSKKDKRIWDFYSAFCQAMRTEGFERKTFADGRTLFELAERAENQDLLDALNVVKPHFRRLMTTISSIAN